MADTDELKGIVSKLQGLAKTADETNKPIENGPNDVQPTLGVKTSELVTLPMTEEQVGDWFKRIKKSQDRRATREKKWDILLKEYLPIVSESGEAETVKMNLHFRNVHTKMASLFFQKPDLILTPKDPGPANNQVPSPLPPGFQPGMQPPPPVTMEDVIAIKQAVLNDKLGADDIDVEDLMDEVLFDVLAWAGIAGVKVGYSCVTKNIKRPKLIQAPAAPSVLGLGSPPGMIQDPSGATENVPVDLFEEWYIRRFSPKKLLLDDALYTGRVQKDSTWIGMEFFMSQARAQKSPQEGGLGLTEDQAKAAAKDDRRFEYEDDASSEDSSGLVHGYEIFCLASIHGGNNPHPKAINQLVLIDGEKTKPSVWRPCVDQSYEEDGTMTKDSIMVFPIQTLSLRGLADTPYVPADAAFTNSGIKQISTWRRQSVKMRDSAQGRYAYDKGAFDEPEIDKLKNGEVGDWVGVEAGQLANGIDKVIVPIAQAHMTQDDYRGMELLKRDNDEMLGVSSTSTGTPEATVQTATQISAIQTAVATRSRKEQGKSSKFYLQCVRLLDTLLMRYATNTDYVLVGGEEAGMKPMLWNNKLISGRYLYQISPDSALQIDNEADYRLTLQHYNLTAGDPLSNRPYLLKRMARMRNMDPAKAVLKPPPPAPKTPVPNVSITLKGDDLMMVVGADGQSRPVNPVAMQLVMRQLEPTPPVPEGMAGSLPPHGGAGGAANKHEASNTGKRPNEPGAPNHRNTDGV